jgi:hypothetical protein
MSLKDYYESHNLNLDSIVSAKAPHRFIRLHPGFDDEETLDLVKVPFVRLLVLTVCQYSWCSGSLRRARPPPADISRAVAAAESEGN